MENINLEFKFKGSRNYVQGPDIYAAAFSKLNETFSSDIGSIEMSFHKLTRKNLTLTFFKNKEEIPLSDCEAVLLFESDSKRFFAGLFENQTEINGSIEYDESKIINTAKIDSQGVNLNLSSQVPYSNLEKVVALNKFYLTDHFSDFKGKWLFTKIQLKKNISVLAPESIELKLVKNIGVKLTKSAILFDQENIGTIYFSMI